MALALSISATAFAGNRGNPLSDFGRALGLDEETADLIGKSARTIKSFQPIQYKEEKAIGGAVALKVFARYGGPYQDEKLSRYVSLVGKNVARVSGRPKIPYYFAILNSREPNAFAAPGGYIFVTLGLILKLNNEAQLAGVLGHEIAHVVKKHSLQAIEESRKKQGLFQGVDLITEEVLDKNPKIFSAFVDIATDALFTNGLDPSLEYEADRLGTNYAERLGYDPRGLKDFLALLSRHQSAGGVSVFSRTHPSARSRISGLERSVLPSFSGRGYLTVAHRFQLMMR